MTEATIRRKAIKKLTEEGWVWWYPSRTRWKKKKDIFGVFDLVVVKEYMTKFIQLTTREHLAERETKVRKFLSENNLKIGAEVWGWNKKVKDFVVIKILSAL